MLLAPGVLQSDPEEGVTSLRGYGLSRQISKLRTVAIETQTT